MFSTVCKVAVVAARPLLPGVQSNPPEIDILFGNVEDIEIDPQREWLMVESAVGYFEAYRHTLKSLQKLANEAFPLAEYIAGVEREIRPPWYLEQQRFKDLSSLFPGTGTKYSHIDVLGGPWPNDPACDLDESQVAALRRILNKELAIIQGPPGTGKTHVSVVALKLLLDNKKKDDPPIIVAAHTNHALDQLLRHVAAIEPEFIRLGGMTTDHVIIKPRTLYEVKEATNLGAVPGGLKGPALGDLRRLTREIQKLLKPLTEGTPLGEETFKAYNILTEGQCKLLVKGAMKWIDTSLPDLETGAIQKWVGDELVQANHRTLPEDFGFAYEEVDLEYEQLKELEAEGKISGDDDFEGLKGEQIKFDEPWTGQESPSKSDGHWESLLGTADLWQIPPAKRGPLYSYMQRLLKQMMLEKMHRLAKEYNRHAVSLKIGKWEVDTNYLQASNIIGCTTTGLSKYRPLLHSLKPRIVLIEEAGETLEAYVTAACFESLEHLILVGDHQQLRGHCNDPLLEGKPWFLDISMFERLVRNQVDFTQLTCQRRMHPEIRRGLMPIYPKLEDHPSVASRVPVPGMGEITTYFFSHTWPEDTDDLMSKINKTETEMIVGFFNYLVNNGMSTKEITVLTFYNGQRKLILAALRRHPNLQGETFKVVTVDSYQGEENGVVILSLVRNSSNNNIGFLSVANRIQMDSMIMQVVVRELAVMNYPVDIFVHSTAIRHATSKRGPGNVPSESLPFYNDAASGTYRGRSKGPQSLSKSPRKSPTKASSQSPSKASSGPVAQHPQELIDMTPEAQAFRNFAAGGYIQADAAAAAESAEAIAEEYRRRLDEENEAALFGDAVGEVLVPRTNQLNLIGTRQTVDGTTRNRYGGTFSNPSVGSRQRKQEQMSLLDLISETQGHKNRQMMVSKSLSELQTGSAWLISIGVGSEFQMMLSQRNHLDALILERQESISTMPLPLSDELRALIKSDFAAGKGIKEVCAKHKISDNKARAMQKLYKATGEVFVPDHARTSRFGRPPKLNEQHVQGLREFREKFPDAFSKDMCEYLEFEFGVEVDEGTIWRYCRNNGWKIHKQKRPRTELGMWARTLPRDENGDPIRNVPKPAKKEMLGKVATQSHIKKTIGWVEEYMSQPRFDASHDFSHVMRVLTLSREILKVERRKHRRWKLDTGIVELLALMHDVEDHKYRPEPLYTTSSIQPQPLSSPAQTPRSPYGHGPRQPSTTAESPIDSAVQPSPQSSQILTPIETYLVRLGWPLKTASTVSMLCTWVSWTAETAQPDQVNDLLLKHPELAIVQDADRLDAIGAIGIGRTFTYGGARGRRTVGLSNGFENTNGNEDEESDLTKQGALGQTIAHFDEKLLKLEMYMKTAKGKRMAKARTERLVMFREWWMEEMRYVGLAKPLVMADGEAAIPAQSEIDKEAGSQEEDEVDESRMDGVEDQSELTDAANQLLEAARS
ncbi:MAG: hypothetical protein Q9222_000066 [Ikaeria aurantiellina]